MDRREPEESSSSPSVNLSIATVQKRGAGKETATVSLSDGSSFFMPLPLPGDWGAGWPLSEDDLGELMRGDAYVRFKEWAASRLAAREDSSGRMYQKLVKKECPPPIARMVVEEMKRLGFLDDRRFAELWVAERLKTRPEGRQALIAGLQQRGVGREIASEIVDREVDTDDEDEALERCIVKWRVRESEGSDRERLIRRLIRRGFSYSRIKNKLVRDRE